MLITDTLSPQAFEEALRAKGAFYHIHHPYHIAMHNGDATRVLPGVRFAVDAYLNFARRACWQEAACSSLTELFAPQIHQSRLDSWPQHYPWIKEEGYFYFRSRLSQANRDVEHGLALAKAYCDSAEKQNRMLEILQFKLDILWSMLDAMTMAYALQRPPYHTVTDKAAWHTTRLV